MSTDARQNFIRAAGATALCLATFSETVPAAEPSWERGSLTLGVGMENGKVRVDSAIPAELDKSGSVKGYKGFIEYHADSYSLMIGGSRESAEAKGEDTVREVGQKTALTSVNVETGVFFNLGYEMQWGFDARFHRGPGADYGVYRELQQREMIDFGPAIRLYTPFLTKWLLRLEGALLTSTTSSPRRVSTLTAGISASVPVPFVEYASLRLGAKALPARDHEEILFPYASEELDDRARKEIYLFARAHSNQDLSARKIVVSGHGSRAGFDRTNLRLSLRRALNVARVLVQSGIPETAIELTGFGKSKIDPSASPVAPEQRRVELRVAPRTPENKSTIRSKVLDEDQIARLAASLKGREPASYQVRISVPSVMTADDAAWVRVERYLELMEQQGIPGDRIVTRTELRTGEIAFNIHSEDGDTNDHLP